MQPDRATENLGPVASPSGSAKTRPAGLLDPADRTSKGRVIELRLTAGQEDLLAPIVRNAAALRRNVLFVATVAPDNGVWRFQVAPVAPALGSKLRSLLKRRPLA